MKILEIKYKCLHPSCVVNCRDGVLAMPEELFNSLKGHYPDETTFRSPKGVCRLGFNQAYRAVAIIAEQDTGHGEETHGHEGCGHDPISLLSADHEVIIKKLDAIEQQIKMRDSNTLWVTTTDLENTIMLHSIYKEEDVLFPFLQDLPLGDGLVSIIKEDHREMVTLMHSFRTGLAEGRILDGLGMSILVCLRSHIRKEDNEFFKLIDKLLDHDLKTRILDGFKNAEGSFVPVVADDKTKEQLKKEAIAMGRDELDDAIAEALEETRSSASGCCH